MKPQNVTHHEHFFAEGDPYEIDIQDDINGRYDACQTRDDGAGVWSPSTGMWWPMKDYEFARLVAEQMALYYRKFYLSS